MLERRRYMRFNANVDIEYKSTQHSIAGISATKDFSREGLRLASDRQLPQGAELEIKVILPDDDRPVFAKGLVIWSAHTEKEGIADTGIRLTQIERFDRARILDYVYNQWLTDVIRTR